MIRQLSFCVLTALLTVFAGVTPASAALIPYSGYDINDAVISGHGLWSHTYSGTIVPGVAFSNAGYGGTTATYSGVGSGTLNDGVIGTSLSSAQLFVTPSASDGTVIDPAIFLTLPFGYTIDAVSLFGGNFGNLIPGKITGVKVTLLKTDFTTVSQTFTTSPFGPSFGQGQVNDLITLTGSSLDGVPAYTVILSDFTGPLFDNWFSLTEIQLDGNLAPTSSAVPEPASLVLFGLGALGLVGCRRRRSS
jgi:hypothetical protein